MIKYVINSVISINNILDNLIKSDSFGGKRILGTRKEGYECYFIFLQPICLTKDNLFKEEFKMGEYSTLTIWKDLEGSSTIFKEAYDLLMKGMEMDKIYAALNVDFHGYGTIDFKSFDGKVHYSHQSHLYPRRNNSILEFKGNIAYEWLTCFEFNDFKIEMVDDFYSLFGAVTTIGEARNRVSNLTKVTNEENEMMDLINNFLNFNSPNDIIILSSENVYWDYSEKETQEEINRLVKFARKQFNVRHWRTLVTN